MIDDFEYLYMIRKKDQWAMDVMMEKYDRLIWSRAHFYYNMYRPQGITVHDLYQEGQIALVASFFSYEINRKVGLAYYIDLCVSSRIKTELRRCRGFSYKMLDTSCSLDMSISEDDSLCLGDMVTRADFLNNPSLLAQYSEAKIVLQEICKELSKQDQEVYRLREEGFSYKEIGLLLGIDDKKVDNIVQKIRRIIRSYNQNKID
ncbi:sigma-70 family RNA polymerase sigma factor [Erysipelothrix urinaevulpis]|uniref:sigma-70 family RNA polymerase sigma factor n=1 Tax=Erysipelothrix urinaevulpis TaxID=2683717 RepID=UPI00135B4032|nr:sigma-70 family RNA polymerase sigma factor [Erysipelothrix urinaevulpis]